MKTWARLALSLVLVGVLSAPPAVASKVACYSHQSDFWYWKSDGQGNLQQRCIPGETRTISIHVAVLACRNVEGTLMSYREVDLQIKDLSENPMSNVEVEIEDPPLLLTGHDRTDFQGKASVLHSGRTDEMKLQVRFMGADGRLYEGRVTVTCP